MKRRTLFQLLAGLPLIGAIPAVRAAAWEPKTVAELVPAVEALFGNRVDETVRAFEEFDAPVSFGLATERPVFRIVPVTWRLIGDSEADLVAQAWKDLKRLARHNGEGTLYWRMRPILNREHDFESGKVEYALRFRAAVLPADWQERAHAGVHREKLRGADWAAPEGSPTRRIS